jgi:hypothetical protein
MFYRNKYTKNNLEYQKYYPIFTAIQARPSSIIFQTLPTEIWYSSKVGFVTA